MSLGSLAWRHAWSHPVRSLLTVGAVAVAVFLVCFLRSIVTSLDAAVTASASNRIVVGSAVSLFQSLPIAYRTTVSEMEGVEDVCSYTWFGGRYQSESNFFAQFGTDPEAMMRMWPEVVLPDEQKRAFVEDRQGCIVGAALADRFGWKIGDTVPLIGTIYRRYDGAEWAFNVRGIYRSTKANVDEVTLFFHWDYLDEVLERGDADGPRGTSVLMVKIAPGYTPEDVSTRIDDHYAAGPQRTRTQPEAAFQASFISMLGNLPVFLGSIGGAVLVALFFGVVNTMTMAARERTRSMGILGALGFGRDAPLRLYLLEAALLVGIGAGVGLLLAWVSQEAFRRLLGTQIPMYHVATDTMVGAGVVALVIAFLAGGIPAFQAARLRAAEALRRGT